MKPTASYSFATYLRVLLPALLLLAASTVQAAVIVGNLAGFTNDSGPASGITSLGGAGKAIGFTLGTTPYDVTGVVLRLNGAGSPDVPQVRLYTSNGTSPVSVVGTFTNPSLTDTTGNYTFTPLAPITLNASTSYFLTVANSSGSATTFNWNNGSPTVTPTGDVSGLKAIFGIANPTTWNSPSSNYNWFELQGTAIPEPSTYAMILGGLAALICFRRRARPSASDKA